MMQPGFSFVDKLKLLSKNGLYFISASSAQKKCWYYVDVDKLKTSLLEQKVKLGHKLNFAEFGKIIACGWGADAPQIVKDKVEKFGAAYDAANDEELVEFYKSKNDVFFIRAISEGHECYYYIAIDGRLVDEFNRACAEENPDFTDYGNIIESGWGFPSEVIQAYMKEKYSITTPHLVG